MKKVTFHIFCILVFLFLSNNNLIFAQTNKKYSKECKKVLKFFRDSLYGHIDTLQLYPFLCNKKMFNGVVLVGRMGLTASEKTNLLYAMQDDTSKMPIPKNLIPRTKLVENKKIYEDNISESDPFIRLSKPIFLRSNLLCVLCVIGNSEKTYLLKKENNRWGLLYTIGQIDNY